MAKKVTRKKTNKKASTAKKATSKKASSKKPAKKATGKKTVKKSSSKTTKKTNSKKTSSSQTARKTTGKKTAKKSTGTSSQKTGQSTTKKSASRKSGETKAPAKRSTKSPLTKKELAAYRAMLMLHRARIVGDLSSMSSEALHQDAANLSHYADHMADLGSDSYEQELTLGLVQSEGELLQEINEALERIEEGTYGICAETGQPINKERLAAKPWAKYCIEAARAMERSGR